MKRSEALEELRIKLLKPHNVGTLGYGGVLQMKSLDVTLKEMIND